MNPIKHIQKYLQDRQLNIRRENAVLNGYFTYFVIKEGTNIRNKTEDGAVIEYYSRFAAELDCSWNEKVVSVSEYNIMFGYPFTW